MFRLTLSSLRGRLPPRARICESCAGVWARGAAMSHDVFISHSSLDKLAADAICHGLEAKGIRCWIAPRDQVAGRAYGQQITTAIETAQVMVLIFSDNVNN